MRKILNINCPKFEALNTFKELSKVTGSGGGGGVVVVG